MPVSYDKQSAHSGESRKSSSGHNVMKSSSCRPCVQTINRLPVGAEFMSTKREGADPSMSYIHSICLLSTFNSLPAIRISFKKRIKLSGTAYCSKIFKTRICLPPTGGFFFAVQLEISHLETLVCHLYSVLRVTGGRVVSL